MEALKVIGYIVIAIAIITAFVGLSVFVVVLGLIGGILINLATGVFFTAATVKRLFESSQTK